MVTRCAIFDASTSGSGVRHVSGLPIVGEDIVQSDRRWPVTPLIDAAELGARIRHRRLGLRLTVRQAAREAEVSPATFSRVERGDHLPGRENLLRLARWAAIKLKDLQVGAGPPKPRAGIAAKSVPERVALHLRADRDLRPDDAEMLADLFRTAYENLRRRRAET